MKIVCLFFSLISFQVQASEIENFEEFIIRKPVPLSEARKAVDSAQRVLNNEKAWGESLQKQKQEALEEIRRQKPGLIERAEQDRKKCGAQASCLQTVNKMLSESLQKLNKDLGETAQSYDKRITEYNGTRVADRILSSAIEAAVAYRIQQEFKNQVEENNAKDLFLSLLKFETAKDFENFVIKTTGHSLTVWAEHNTAVQIFYGTNTSSSELVFQLVPMLTTPEMLSILSSKTAETESSIFGIKVHEMMGRLLADTDPHLFTRNVEKGCLGYEGEKTKVCVRPLAYKRVTW